MSLNRSILVCVTALGVRCAGAVSIAGTYSGHYRCAVTRNLDLQITDLGGGRIQAVFTFSGAANGAYTMSGSFDIRSGHFHLDPQQWINRPAGFNMLGLDGVFDPRTRRLTGRIPTFGCTTFELGPPGSGIRPPAPPQAPLRHAQPAENPLAGFEYWDATMDAPRGQPRESEPIDDVIDWLRKQGFSCMGSTHVIWDQSGTKGSAPDYVRTRERYVVECDGDCRGLRYLPYTDAQIYAFGKSQPAPLMEIKTTWFGGRGFRWEVRRTPNGHPPPDVYIHRWTNSGFNSGGDCRAPQALSR